MSPDQKQTWINDLARRSPPGDRPWGLYWAMPVVVGAATVCVGVIVASHPSTPLRIIAAGAWGVVLFAVAWHVIRQRGWDREQHRRRLTALEALIELTAASGADADAEMGILHLLPK